MSVTPVAKSADTGTGASRYQRHHPEQILFSLLVGSSRFGHGLIVLPGIAKRKF